MTLIALARLILARRGKHVADPGRGLSKTSTATISVRRKTVELKSVRIPICYYSEKNKLFTAAWWKEVTQRESFWEEFRTKVNPGTIRRRFTVSVNLGFDKNDLPHPVNQQKQVQSSGQVPSAVSIAAPNTPSHGVNEEAPTASTCNVCGSLLTAEQECESCLAAEDELLVDDSEGSKIKSRKTNRITIRTPGPEPKDISSGPKPPGYPTRGLSSEATPDPSSALLSVEQDSSTGPVLLTTGHMQPDVDMGYNSDNSPNADDANTDEKDDEFAIRKLRSGTKVAHTSLRVEDGVKLTDLEQEESDTKIRLELPSGDEPTLKIGTMTSHANSIGGDWNQNTPDSILAKQQVKAEDEADAKVALASPTDMETKIRGVKVEDNVEPLGPVIGAYVKVRHGGADHIVPSGQLTRYMDNGEEFFVVRFKGAPAPAIVPAAEVGPLSDLPLPLADGEAGLVKVKIEEETDREQAMKKGLRRGRERTLIEID